MHSGRTTRQIIGAPVNAIYVCPTSSVSYYVNLAWNLDRADLNFVGPTWIRQERLRGQLNIVIDHAVYLEESVIDMLDYFISIGAIEKVRYV